jgi:hypothetical protein
MKSNYGNRETHGTTYLKAQQNDMRGITVGDVNTDLVKGLVEDLNDTISSNPFGGDPFFISVIEERDLQMKNAIKRRMFVSKYRPYPEDNTLVFYVEPRNNKVCYCWDVPHHSEMPNILSNADLYDTEYVSRIKDWLRNDLYNFGFTKVNMSSSQVEGLDEKVVNRYRQAYYEFCESNGCSEEELETIKKYGHFWVPNPNHVDSPYKEEIKVSLIGID